MRAEWKENDMADHETLAELESRIAFQEDAIDKLSDMVAKQEMDLERLTRMVKILNAQLRELGSEGDLPSADEAPPHY
jgi:SlyX protein